jgi:Actin
MPSSIRRIDVAGRDVTEYMQTLLRKAGYIFHTSAEKEVVRMIKEKVSYVAADPKREEKEWNAGKGDGKIVEYVLPDGNKLMVIPLPSNAEDYTDKSRSAPSGSAPLKSSSTPKSSASSTPESTKSSSTLSTARTSTSANHSSATSSCPVAAHSQRGSATGYCMKFRDSR